MKIKSLIWATAEVLVVLGLAFSTGAQGLENPVGSPTVPPSSLGGGLITNPRGGIYETTPGSYGNLVITGNVTGGKYFRGIVPYRSISEFSAPLGSSSLNSFLRDSAGSYSFDRAPGTPQSYYLPSQTVTSMQRGSVSGLEGPSMLLNKGTGGFVAPLQKLPEGLKSVRDEFPTEPVYRKFRPISDFSEQLKALRKSQEGIEPAQEAETEVGDQRIAELRRELAEVRKKARRLALEKEDASLTLPEKTGPGELFTLRPPLLQKLRSPASEQQKSEDASKDDILKAQQALQEFMKQNAQAQDGVKEPPAKQEESPAIESDDGELYPAAKSSKPLLETPFGKTMLKLKGSISQPGGEQFEAYLIAGQDYLQKGRYYRAADKYTLASILRPEDPLPYAGKAHALFAAGEYVSCAFFLAKAIESFPGYTTTADERVKGRWEAGYKINLIEFIGDRDKLDARMNDLAKWLKQSGSGELGFVLAYVLYNMDRVHLAKKAIATAIAKMPDAKAVHLLKQAIDKAVKESESMEWK